MNIKWISTDRDFFWFKKDAEAVSIKEEPDLILTDKKDQVIKGFGGCFNELGWSVIKKLSQEKKEEVMKNLFSDDGCAFSFCRMPIGASDYALEWYSLDDTPDDLALKHFNIERDKGCLIPYIKEALSVRPSISFFASPWSPPAWMKTHRTFNFGVLREEPEIMNAYALYFVKTVRSFAEEGIKIEQIHPQNEPVADQKFPSCIWTGVKMKNFISKYLGPAFYKDKTPSEIWLGTLNCDDFNEWILTPLSDPLCKKYVKGIGLQWWGKRIIQRTRISFPEMPLIQTENECGDGKNSWEYAFYVFDLIWHYITNGVIAYVYWNMVLPAGGESTWGWKQNSMICIDPVSKEVRYNPEFWVMKHISHFVLPGSTRLELKGKWAGNALSFLRPDNKTVVVFSNPLPEERIIILQSYNENIKLKVTPFSFNTLVLE